MYNVVTTKYKKKRRDTYGLQEKHYRTIGRT